MSTIEMNLNGFTDFQQLKKTVADQGEIIQEQALQIHRLQDTVYQHLGLTFKTTDNVVQLRYALQQIGASLYNQKTQQASWREMRDLIMPTNQYWIDPDSDSFTRPEDTYGDEAVDTSKWTTPTTRQGDVLEQKVAELEKKITRIDAIFTEKQRAVATLPVELVLPKKITNSKWTCGNE
jgi:hypothetical protein